MDSSMDRSMESERGERMEENYGHRYSVGHRRSMSDPEPRRGRDVVVEIPNYMKQDSKGVLWRKTAVVNEDLLPDDPAWRNYASNRLMDLGYGDLETYENVQVFVISLPRLARGEDLDFVLDTKVWNFMMANWVKDSSRGAKFDYGISMNVRNKLIKRRADIMREVIQQKNIDEYGRELCNHQEWDDM